MKMGGNEIKSLYLTHGHIIPQHDSSMHRQSHIALGHNTHRQKFNINTVRLGIHCVNYD